MSDNKNEFNEATKQKIIKLLQEKGAMLPCPRCGNTEFLIADGFTQSHMSTQINHIVFGNEIIPKAIVVCRNCGFLSEHALGVLGYPI